MGCLICTRNSEKGIKQFELALFTYTCYFDSYKNMSFKNPQLEVPQNPKIKFLAGSISKYNFSIMFKEELFPKVSAN